MPAHMPLLESTRGEGEPPLTKLQDSAGLHDRAGQGAIVTAPGVTAVQEHRIGIILVAGRLK
ncbi:hypothetical protein Dda_9450 [Drechslerella dactyloides]|uniref:Uncharacterized protein n=1 Tax=Drechslerella dactyloides TaxID=74499 RepID=A0AAD6IQU3_DREDA|nr:hypothetical protein Dda_9450 [Drechslerella dactyloides]